MAANHSATLCANHCGFYGNPKTHSLCSLCYANFLKQKLQQIPSQEPILRPTRSLRSSKISPDLVGISEPAAPKGGNRCKTCKKKLGLLGFKCRCGDSFCGKHRHPEEHSCGVDRKSIGRQILADQIVECKADKLEFRV